MQQREFKYIAGDHLVTCDRCGRTNRKSTISREPKTGYWVCSTTCVDIPHPQQYRTPAKPDDQRVHPVRPPAFSRNNSVIVDATDPAEIQRNLPEIGGGSIDESGYNFLSVGDVDPSDY